MAQDMIVDEVIKGGKTWFELAIGRNGNGMTMFLRTDPEVEAFMRNLGNGKMDGISAYSDYWTSLTGTPLNVYRLEKNFESSPRFSIGNPGESLRLEKGGKVNISFLRLVGVGSPAGVQFGISGPVSRQYITDTRLLIVQAVRELIKEYIAPIHIVLRITSQEV
jgi:hypothetical protein